MNEDENDRPFDDEAPDPESGFTEVGRLSDIVNDMLAQNRAGILTDHARARLMSKIDRIDNGIDRLLAEVDKLRDEKKWLTYDLENAREVGKALQRTIERRKDKHETALKMLNDIRHGLFMVPEGVAGDVEFRQLVSSIFIAEEVKNL